LQDLSFGSLGNELELVRSSMSAQRIRERLPIVRFGVLAEGADNEYTEVVEKFNRPKPQGCVEATKHGKRARR